MSDQPQQRLSPSEQLLRFFEAGHLPQGMMRNTSMSVGVLAHEINNTLPDGPEKTAGLRKLLEAKDCFVRAALL